MTPTQTELDILAAFVETAGELRTEPFFDPYENSKYTHQGDKLIVMELGDRFHFRSALIPFRRIWREREDTYYGHILDLIARFRSEANAQNVIAACRTQHREIESRPSYPPYIDLPGKQLVDGWLYSVFIHTNLTRKKRNPPDPTRDFDRRTFEGYLQKYGHAWLEYAFRGTVRDAGRFYFQILDALAAPLLAEWLAMPGAQSSFRMISPFGNAPRERAPDGTIIIRKASSFYGIEETLLQKLRRLLARFSLLKSTFESLKLEPEELLKAVVSSRTVKQVVGKAGWEMHLAEHFTPTEEFRSRHQSFDQMTRSNTNIWFSDDRVMIISKNTVRIWSRDFSKLKELL